MDETLTPPPRCARTPRRVVIRVLSVMALMLAGCAGDGGVHNEGGSATTYRDSSQRGPVSGVGIEGQDIVAMTDAMMRDLLQVPLLAAAATPPRVIIDAAHFTNDSSQRIDRNLIADRLRVGLARAAKGRLAFVGREHRQVVAAERDLKRSGQVDRATRAAVTRQAGADYRLVGRISTLDSRDNTTGMTQRFTQIVFDMIDLETGLSIWTNLYSFTEPPPTAWSIARAMAARAGR